MRKVALMCAIALPALTIGCSGPSAEADPAAQASTWDGALVQYGTMHEAIGEGRDQGRVRLAELVARPHFHGVAALESLQGEVTILDGRVIVTRVDEAGSLQSADGAVDEGQATLLVGAYVPRWNEYELPRAVDRDGFDQAIADAAARSGVDTSAPFVFTVEGEFVGLSLHVIHGACPIRARMRKLELPPEQRPFEAELPALRGRMVGIYAPDAVGELTHPDTSTHTHVVFEDEASGTTFTAHVEWVGMAKGSRLRFPA